MWTAERVAERDAVLLERGARHALELDEGSGVRCGRGDFGLLRGHKSRSRRMTSYAADTPELQLFPLRRRRFGRELQSLAGRVHLRLSLRDADDGLPHLQADLLAGALDADCQLLLLEARPDVVGLGRSVPERIVALTPAAYSGTPRRRPGRMNRRCPRRSAACRRSGLRRRTDRTR